MDAKWQYCTRPVCRLRSDVSRDRQIYTRRRRVIGDTKPSDPILEHEYLSDEEVTENKPSPLPGRYCAGLCEIEPPPERTLPKPRRKKLLKG
jgi:hypothetical protein